MSLKPGVPIGSYEVVALVGAGGMGEVYRARDSKLGRNVALKILPAAFSTDPDRLARFKREAQVLASLNHPNIGAIYGLEEAGGVCALVLELVDGPTLADRIAGGPIPPEEAASIARQIAEALESAHEQGVIHRDLKPSNIKLRPDGMVKVLDFGLAKALEPVWSGSAGPSASTITSPAMTGIGTILGTAAYMSPEQALGKPVDRRADIWAFGCVLYEMLTGMMAFRGEVVTETLAAVIRADPDWSLLPAATAQHIRVLLQRCLQKNPRQRLQAIGDARIALEEVLSGTSESPPPRPPRWRFGLASGVAGALIAATAAGVFVWNLKPRPAASAGVHRFSINLPAGQRLAGMPRPVLALSADGTQLAYVATAQGEEARQIYLWSMERGEARPIPGTTGATDPFFSPDGQWLAFHTETNALVKIPVRGGVAQALTNDVLPWGASWGSNHMIAFAPYLSVLHRVSDDGGTPQPLTRFERGETQHLWPEFLPGANAMLFNAVSDAPQPAIAVQSLGAGTRRNVPGHIGTMPRYAPSGHLVYAQIGNLMAVPFDIDRLEVKDKATATPVVQGVLQSRPAFQYSLSGTGSLAYVPGPLQAGDSTLVWVSRNGTEQVLGAPARLYNQPRVSGDGQRVVVDVIEGGGMQVWRYDVPHDQFTPLTYKNDGVNRHALWAPDSKRIVFMSSRKGATQIFSQLADGAGLEQLTDFAPTSTGDTLPIPYSFCGEALTVVRLAPVPEFWVLQMGLSSTESGPSRKARRLPLQIPIADGAPQLSPDCHWLAYASDESGRREI
jgi:eukaryotic-like serine/threonine-protein kinase